MKQSRQMAGAGVTFTRLCGEPPPSDYRRGDANFDGCRPLEPCKFMQNEENNAGKNIPDNVRFGTIPTRRVTFAFGAPPKLRVRTSNGASAAPLLSERNGYGRDVPGKAEMIQ